MYKVASDLAQRRGRQLWLSDLVGPDFDELSEADQIVSLRRAACRMQDQIVALPKGSDRTRLCEQRAEVAEALSKLKVKVRMAPGLPARFMDVVRERVTKFQYRLYMDEAIARVKADEERLASQSPE